MGKLVEILWAGSFSNHWAFLILLHYTEPTIFKIMRNINRRQKENTNKTSMSSGSLRNLRKKSDIDVFFLLLPSLPSPRWLCFFLFLFLTQDYTKTNEQIFSKPGERIGCGARKHQLTLGAESIEGQIQKSFLSFLNMNKIGRFSRDHAEMLM